MKKDFRTVLHNIQESIKKECLSFGMGTIKLAKDIDDLWIDDYENYHLISIHVEIIIINYNQIILKEDGFDALQFDAIHSLNRLIDIYDVIYTHQNQLHFYELDWGHYFNALRVKRESKVCIWRILTFEEAKHIWYNGKGEICQLYDDGTERMILDDRHLNKCIEKGDTIGIIALLQPII